MIILAWLFDGEHGLAILVFRQGCRGRWGWVAVMVVFECGCSRVFCGWGWKGLQINNGLVVFGLLRSVVATKHHYVAAEWLVTKDDSQRWRRRAEVTFDSSGQSSLELKTWCYRGGYGQGYCWNIKKLPTSPPGFRPGVARKKIGWALHHIFHCWILPYTFSVTTKQRKIIFFLLISFLSLPFLPISS